MASSLGLRDATPAASSQCRKRSKEAPSSALAVSTHRDSTSLGVTTLMRDTATRRVRPSSNGRTSSVVDAMRPLMRQRPQLQLSRSGLVLRQGNERGVGRGRRRVGPCKAADRVPPTLPPPLDPLPDPDSLPKATPGAVKGREGSGLRVRPRGFGGEITERLPLGKSKKLCFLAELWCKWVVRDQEQSVAKLPVGGLKGWVTLAAWLFLFGFGLGPPLDGFHSEVGLQTYDVGDITIGGEPYGLHTSIWVFPMLGAFYSVVGVLQLLLDRFLAKPGQLEKGSWGGMLTSLMVLVGLLRLSAQLYEDEMPYAAIFGILAIAANANWYAFERTWWGYALALLVAVGAPASEVFIMRWFSLWHYSCPDLQFGNEGIVSWTSCCYFFYTQFLACLARCLETELLPEVVSATSAGAGAEKPEQTPKA